MKALAILVIMPVITACATVKPNYIQTEPSYIKNSITVPQWLQSQGYSDFYITGDRTSDCEDDHAIQGTGVLVKDAIKPKPYSAVVCQDFDGNYFLVADNY